MNIFNVLSQGKSSLHEPSVSAMLSYLLSPNGDHGIGDTFLRSFIQLIEEKSEHSENFFNTNTWIKETTLIFK